MKEVVISTEAVNSYGTRVLTAGIELEQFKRNPVLLWMHRRAWNGKDMPIGRIENLRVEAGKLIGTPVFDQADEFAKQIESKWENGFLRMASAGLEPLETSAEATLVMPGQTRETVTRCKLVEVSIVDIGGNDEALQLLGSDAKLLKLAAGEECSTLPLLARAGQADVLEKPEERPEEKTIENTKNKERMKKEDLELLGLSEGATEEQISAALGLMKAKADSVDGLQLAAVTQAVDRAIAERRILAEQREHFVKLGKSAGVALLEDTLKTMPVQERPSDVINLSRESEAGGAVGAESYKKLSEVPEEKLLELRKSSPGEYMRLYKAEYGVDCPALSE